MFELSVEKNPTEVYLWEQIRWYLLFMLLALSVPLLSLLLPMPAGETIGTWFQRSGALSAVFALRAESYAASMWEELNRGGMVGGGFNEVRRKYFYWVRGMRVAAYLAIAAATLVWGYGDLLVASI